MSIYNNSDQKNVSFLACPLRTDMFPDSLNLLAVVRTVDDEMPRVFGILCLETLLNYLTLWPYGLSTNDDAFHIFTSERLSISGVLFLYPAIILTVSSESNQL